MNKLFEQCKIWFQLVIQSFRKQRFRLSMIIIQLCIGFVCIGTGLGMLEGMQRFVTDTKQMMPTDTIQLWMKSLPRSHSGEADEVYDPYLDVMKQIEHHEDVKITGSFVVENYPFHGERYDVSFVDPSFADMLHVNIKKGSSLTEGMFDDLEPVPAVIHHDLAEDYPIGATFIMPIPDPKNKRMTEIEVETVGVLAKNHTYWQGAGSHIINTYTKDEFFIMLPMQPEIRDSTLTDRLSTNTLIQLTDPERIGEFTTDVEQIMKEKEIDWEMHTIQELIDDVNEANRPITIYTTIFALLLLGLSALGLLGVTLASMLQRQQEFGIRYAIGSPPTYISLLVVGEVIILVLFAALLSIIPLILIKTFMTIEYLDFGPLTIGTTFALILIISLVVSLFPAYQAYKTEPIEMIRRTT